MATDSKRVIYVCEACGSDLVTLDAWAEWDVETQAFARKFNQLRGQLPKIPRRLGNIRFG